VCVLTCFRKYNKFGRTYLFQIDFYHLRPTESSANGDDDEWQTKYVVDAYHAGNVSSASSGAIAFVNFHIVHSFSGMLQAKVDTDFSYSCSSNRTTVVTQTVP
jgi:hypothetical protein